MAGNISCLNDDVHGQIFLPPLCKKIIDTPEFQRLRNIKQIGVCPTASHNRFEHCIGTAHLARTYITAIHTRQPDLGITEEDILCVTIAGLCHDLGHGPLSHLWQKFVKRAGGEFKHEDLSVKLFQSIYEKLRGDFQDYNLTAIDAVFIAELIKGKTGEGNTAELSERRTAKYFLYQIVSNSLTGIDVDKFDYIRRDYLHLHFNTTFDWDQIMDNSIVVQERGPENAEVENHRYVLAYREEIVDNIEDLFLSRYKLHQTVCQHQVTIVIEEMVIEALLKSNQQLRLFTAHNALKAFVDLTDSIIDILNVDGSNETKKLIEAVRSRKLFAYFGYVEDDISTQELVTLRNIDPAIEIVPSVISDGKKTDHRILLFDKNERVHEKLLVPPIRQVKHHIVLKKVGLFDVAITDMAGKICGALSRLTITTGVENILHK